MAASSRRWSGPNGGNAAVRPPVIPVDLDPLEVDGFEDDDQLTERTITGFAVATDAERVSLGRCVVDRVRLTGARLRRLDLADVRIVDCDLNQVVLDEAILHRVRFERCRLTEADLGGARLVDVAFVDCQLDGAALRLAQAERLEVRGGSATGLDLYRAKAAGSAWLDTDLSAADLSGADLARARFVGSKLADLRGAAALRGAVIGRDQVVDVGLGLIADTAITVVDAV